MRLFTRLLALSGIELMNSSLSVNMLENTSKVPLVFISCGSFNPVTNMHLRMFEIAKNNLESTGKYDVVAGIMSPVSSGYKKKGLISSELRCKMLELALDNHEWVKLDKWEAMKDEWTLTVDVLRHHREKLKKIYGNDTQLMFLCGADLLESFLIPGVWKNDHIKEILSDFGLACVNRMGSQPDKIIYENDILYVNRKNINLVTDWIVNDISSTKIRRAVSRNESIKYLTCESVEKFIHQNQLYKN